MSAAFLLMKLAVLSWKKINLVLRDLFLSSRFVLVRFLVLEFFYLRTFVGEKWHLLA